VKLARINTFLLIAILLINGYILVLPIVPQITFWSNTHDGHTVQRLEAKVRTPSPTNPSAQQQMDNQLIIPSMAFDEPINQGKTAIALRKGLWLRPNGSTPDKGSNTVIAGHRFTYTNPRGVLYSLNKVHVGDSVGVWWQNKHYLYQVTETKEVGPNEVSIEDPTTDSRLTIYTCTPLWMPKDRLVVVATLEKVE
jgi:sortase A